MSGCPKFFISLVLWTEIDDFLDEDECDLLIELAKRKKMKEHNDRSIDDIIQDGPEKTFHTWDLNDDSLIDNEEVGLNQLESFITITLIAVFSDKFIKLFHNS